MAKKLLYLLVFTLATGCALPRQINSPDALSKIRSIAIVSAIEDRVNLSYVGFTVFNNKQETAPVDWQLSDRVHQLTVAALQGKYNIRTFSYDRAAFRGAENSTDATLGTAKEATARLKQVAKPGIADAILVIAGNSSGSVSSNRYGNFVGTGFTATVFDGTTLEPIAQAYGGIRCQRIICANGFDFPSQRVEFGWSGEPWAQMSQQRKDDIRSIVMKLIDESVPHALGRLKLIELPPST